MNFSDQTQTTTVKGAVGSWRKILDSSEWVDEASVSAEAQICSNEKLNLPPESLLVYQTIKPLDDEDAWQMLGHS
jgi:hypothetical protein